ncbi:hypothetical protein BDN72DRAFT_950021 [Pluteus cervinus]|uniref:Uncharacterized protein n=1 Tax=Pluteus cervinus TaxID=181527 RepID=A0ACD2ZZ84_9AGAR|nr:hypothetical protein BDN72DRAFT_950021 [Pluteus cervinus]
MNVRLGSHSGHVGLVPGPSIRELGVNEIAHIEGFGHLKGRLAKAKKCASPMPSNFPRVISSQRVRLTRYVHIPWSDYPNFDFGTFVITLLLRFAPLFILLSMGATFLGRFLTTFGSRTNGNLICDINKIADIIPNTGWSLLTKVLKVGRQNGDAFEKVSVCLYIHQKVSSDTRKLCFDDCKKTVSNPRDMDVFRVHFTGLSGVE